MTEVDGAEDLARFLFSKNDFARTKGRVRHPAFMPHEGETSVFRVPGLSPTEIWDIGEREAAPTRTASMKAWAQIKASQVFKNDLTVVPDEPPPRHAAIRGWPSEDRKELVMNLAQTLAASATLQLPPS